MRISRREAELIQRHAHEAYPAECFGFLVGRFDESGLVYYTVRGSNISEAPQTHFEMKPGEFSEADENAAGKGVEIIGYYHSHPFSSAEPSAEDLSRAWPGYYYLIVSLANSGSPDMTVWRTAGAAPGEFGVEPLEITGMA